MGKTIPEIKNTKPKLKKSIKKPKQLQTISVSSCEANTTEELPKRNYVMLNKLPWNEKQIREGVSALYQLTNQKKTKPELFDEEHPIFLQVTCVKVPQTPIRHIRFNLKHGLLTDSSEICLIVSDKGKRKEYDSTIEYYENLLSNHGITNIKTILPYHQFRHEYGSQFELKRKLLGLYDYFLVDAKVAGYVSHLLGSIFFESRKMPTIVKMNLPNLKEHLERSLKQTIMKIHAKGDSYALQIGHTFMPEEHVYENINELVGDFRNQFPGGVENVRSLGIKTSKSLTIPIFLTLKNKKTVDVPICKPQLSKHCRNVRGELSTYINNHVIVTPEGKVRVRRGQTKEDEVLSSIRKELDADDDISSDDEDKPQVLAKAADVPKSKNVLNDSSDEENDKLVQAEEDYLMYYEQEHDEEDLTEQTTKETKKAKKVKN